MLVRKSDPAQEGPSGHGLPGRTHRGGGETVLGHFSGGLIDVLSIATSTTLFGFWIRVRRGG